MNTRYKKVFPVNKLGKELSAILNLIQAADAPVGFKNFLSYAVSELLANVKEHAQAKRVNVVVIADHQQWTLKVADDGIGFLKNYLTKGVYPKDDFAAIELALGGLSTKSPTERGFGLYSIRRLVENLGGIFIIKAGLATAEIKENQINFKRNSKRTAGAEMTVKVPIKNINIYQILK